MGLTTQVEWRSMIHARLGGTTFVDPLDRAMLCQCAVLVDVLVARDWAALMCEAAGELDEEKS
jgi:hypothetical protein